MTAIHSRWRDAEFTRAKAAFWLLSLALARRHFERVVLVADEVNAARLERLGARYDEVHVVLDVLEPCNIWALGKIAAYAYAARHIGPFCHIDGDVFLTKALPERLLAAPVFAERTETWTPRSPCWRQNSYSGIAGRAWPHRMRDCEQRAYCAGILGGRDMPRIADYADRSLALARLPAWREMDGTQASVWLEQYALADFEPVATLFPPWPTEVEVKVAGYVHLQGNSKNWPPFFEAAMRWLREVDPPSARVVDTLEEA